MNKICVLLLILLHLIPAKLHASWSFSADADLRSNWSSADKLSAEVHAAGLSIRKSFADNSGDRYIISGLFEAENNFSEFMIHELYFRYKGPMGLWNITAGRIGIPYGLLTSFSTTRHIFEKPIEEIIGFDADNGIMFSGVAGIFDYGFSLTQGYGAHRMPEFPGEGFGAGRVGVTLGEAEEYSIGVSVSGGRTSADHMDHSAITRITGGLDATLNIGQSIIRTEVNAGIIDKHRVVSGYGLLDYTLHRRLDLSAGIRVIYSHNVTDGALFAGLSFNPPWFNLRGGYIYEHSDKQKHSISLQLYRLFSFTL
jgi:hypothetical protein